MRISLDRKVGDLTVLEFQDFLHDLDDDNGTLEDSCPSPQDIDLANRIQDLSVRQMVIVMRHSLPRGKPAP
jgi:hypothetical protein